MKIKPSIIIFLYKTQHVITIHCIGSLVHELTAKAGTQQMLKNILVHVPFLVAVQVLYSCN